MPLTESSNVKCRPVTPGTPDSANILIGAAGYAAHDRRQQHHHHQQQHHQQQQQRNNNIQKPKSIMNCFRDRSSSYTRTQHNAAQPVVQYKQPTAQPSGTGRPEAVVFLRELRTRPNRLSLLKSSSTRDLSRLLLDAECQSNGLPSSPSLEMLTTSTSSGASTTSGSPAQQQRNKQRNVTECCATCQRRWQDMKQRIRTLERNLQEQVVYTRELETKLSELTKTFHENNEKNRKKPPPPVKKTTNGANGGGIHTSKLVAWMNMSNWWKSRPSIETLKQQNIYNDEPCFDTEIEMVLKHEQHKTVPRIVVDCCDHIEELYRRSAQPIEGIYRQCGDYNKIQTLRFSIDANDYESLRQPNIDIHTLSGVLKLFLREIKSPLVSTNEAKTFIGKPNQWLLTELPMKIDILKRLIRSLPEINRDTMDYLFGHFNRLTKVPLQQISAETLSISVTPSIFHTVPQGVHMQDIQTLLRDSEMLADCVKIMIEYHTRIFECTADLRLRQRLSVRQLKKTLSQPDLLFHNLF